VTEKEDRPCQSREIIKGIHDIINGVEKRPSAAQTYVLINEVAPGGWGSAGNVYPPGN
jgi:phenylpyruvate tautomerase PptA (4-oxalocrotonate tautomerase family)